MRKFLVVIALFGLVLAACAEEAPDTAPAAQEGENETPAPCDRDDPPLLEEGVLTVATDRPAYPPWFEGSPKNYTGFEGDVASEVATRLGLEIKWVVEPFNKSYAPGNKDYDFDINQISITPEREEVVDFSDGYFNNNQGLLALEDSPIAGAGSLAELKGSQLGAQVGTTSLAFINTLVQPDNSPKIFDTTNDLKSALDSGQIDGFFTDLVTTVYLRDFEIDGSVVVGQYPTEEPFGMLFEEGNLLVHCVNDLIVEMRNDGTLESLEEQWLQDYLSVPVLSD
jgi:polar amino acid transport system substrate-binding protein